MTPGDQQPGFWCRRRWARSRPNQSRHHGQQSWTPHQHGPGDVPAPRGSQGQERISGLSDGWRCARAWTAGRQAEGRPIRGTSRLESSAGAAATSHSVAASWRPWPPSCRQGLESPPPSASAEPRAACSDRAAQCWAGGVLCQGAPAWISSGHPGGTDPFVPRVPQADPAEPAGAEHQGNQPEQQQNRAPIRQRRAGALVAGSWFFAADSRFRVTSSMRDPAASGSSAQARGSAD